MYAIIGGVLKRLTADGHFAKFFHRLLILG